MFTNPYGVLKSVLGLICEFSKTAGYKVNTQKVTVFLSTNKQEFKTVFLKIPRTLA